MLIFHLLHYAAVLKDLAYYAKYHAYCAKLSMPSLQLIAIAS